MKRYFIVSYTFNTISKASGNGSICIYTHGFYASKQSIAHNVGYSDETANGKMELSTILFR